MFISDGNSKIGVMHNISLPPVISCGKGVPAVKFPDTMFFGFSKRHDILKKFDPSLFPKNFRIIASMWIGWGNVEDVKGVSECMGTG